MRNCLTCKHEPEHWKQYGSTVFYGSPCKKKLGTAQPYMPGQISKQGCHCWEAGHEITDCPAWEEREEKE